MMLDSTEPRTQFADLVANAARRLAFAADAVARMSGQIEAVARAIEESMSGDGKLLVFGNGGSAAGAQHFAAEFTGKLALDRKPLPAISLTVDTSAITAIANDYGYQDIFARQVEALAAANDVVIGLSTSGASANVKAAIDVARRIGACTVVLTGKGNAIRADHELAVPVRETARVQEAHDLILHEIAQIAERMIIRDLGCDGSADRFPYVLREQDIEPFRAWIGTSNQELVTTNGVFDLLHEGHRSSLSQAITFGDRLVVLVNSDDSVRRLKGATRPIRTLDDRVRDLATCHAVDHVVVMPDDDPERLLAALRPHVHCKGADYADSGVPEAAVVESGGGRMEYLALNGAYSTSIQESRMVARNE